jgi:hypothetical protein
VIVFKGAKQKQSRGANRPRAILGPDENGLIYFKQNFAMSALIRRIIVRTVYPSEFECT